MKCGVPVYDFTAGLYAAFAIAAALRRVQADGQGTHIDVSMLGATLGIAALQTSQYFGTGVDPVKLGSAHPRNAPYQVFRCKNGYFGMAAGNNSLWKAVCKVVERDDLHADPRFANPTDRAEHQVALRDILRPSSPNTTPMPGWSASARPACRARPSTTTRSAGRPAGRTHGLGAGPRIAQRRAHPDVRLAGAF